MAQSTNRAGIFIEVENNTVKDTALGALTAAAGCDIHALVLQGDVNGVKDTLAAYGAGHIVDITASADLSKSPDLQAQALEAAVKEFNLDTLMGVASPMGQDLFARIAARMDAPLVSDCIRVDTDNRTAVKSHFSGKTFAQLKVDAPVFLCTLRPNSVEPREEKSPGEIVAFKADIEENGRVSVIETIEADGGKIDLAEASIIISGGRAMESAQNFELLDACAQKLGAAVGASRAAVDAGFAPHTIQVGQTGKTVSPKLYIACGISGAVQHFAGMKTSKVIVAVNKDKDAPIFSKSDYGIVGDIFDVVPKLTENL